MITRLSFFEEKGSDLPETSFILLLEKAVI
jgi:hypothetical protein